jgi:hypothetical protein
VACWAHTRRYWHKAREEDPARAHHVLAVINGAAAGANKIFMKKFDFGGGGLPGMDSSIRGMDEKQMAAMQAAQSNRGGKSKSSASMIPPEYSDPKTTKLTFPVPDGGSESADFRLSAK